MFTSLSALLPKAVTSHGLSTRLYAVSLRERFTALVALRWGASAARMVTVRNVEGGVLFVEVKSSALAHELMVQSHEVLKALSHEVPDAATSPRGVPRIARIRAIIR